MSQFKRTSTILENRISNFQKMIIFLGKIIRLPKAKISSRLISNFCTNIRPQGRSNLTIRHFMLNDVKKIPTVDKSGPFHN